MHCDLWTYYSMHIYCISYVKSGHMTEWIKIDSKIVEFRKTSTVNISLRFKNCKFFNYTSTTKCTVIYGHTIACTFICYLKIGHMTERIKINSEIVEFRKIYKSLDVLFMSKIRVRKIHRTRSANFAKFQRRGLTSPENM